MNLTRLISIWVIGWPSQILWGLEMSCNVSEHHWSMWEMWASDERMYRSNCMLIKYETPLFQDLHLFVSVDMSVIEVRTYLMVRDVKCTDYRVKSFIISYSWPKLGYLLNLLFLNFFIYKVGMVVLTIHRDVTKMK
jgi:hypothetical protein